MIYRQFFVGTGAMIAGAMIFCLFAGALVMRIVGAFFGLMLIHVGLRTLGYSSRMYRFYSDGWAYHPRR